MWIFSCFSCEWIAGMMNFYVFIVVCFGGRSFSTNYTNERPFARVYSLVFLQIVCSVKVLAACITTEFLECFMLTSVPQPIVFTCKLTPAMVTCIRLNSFVRVHMGNVFAFTYKCFRAHAAFKWL